MFDLKENEYEGGTHFYMKGFAGRLRQRKFDTEAEMIFWKYPTNFLVRVNSGEEIGDHTRQQIILNDWIKNKIEFE